ncbi:MAG TPA: DUF3303 family protein [Caldilineae bacterium]|jgi:hypothetical protein|nr:DUF3303 family protein [Caldilineae bacterium]
MKFVLLWSLKAGVDQAKLAEVMRCRGEWKFPEGVRLLAEYWAPQNTPTVIDILEADDATALLVNTVGWIDVMEARIFPVVTWEEGLEKLGRLFA